METLLGKLINNSVRTNASNTLMYFANSILTVIFKLREPEDSVPTIGKSSKHQFNMFAMPTPTPAMLANDPIWDAIYKTIRTWDVNVPEYYNGYCGANGSHVTLIYNAVIKAPLK